MNAKESVLKLIKPINVPFSKKILAHYYDQRKQLNGTNRAKKVLVLAPHMDDETIGLGGTIRRHANEGAEVHCVLITDGSNSVTNLSKNELIEERKQEMDQVKDILGLADIHYMGLPDGKVTSEHVSQQILQKIIESTQPDIIYSTLFIDAHPDHTETAKMLADTLNNLSNQYTVRLYEINCAIPPEVINCIVDISTTFKDKKRAINQFKSQAIAFDGFLELNRLKANLVEENVNAVECFLELSSEKFIEHCNKLLGKRQMFPKLFKQINRTDTLLWAIYKNKNLKLDMYNNSLSALK